MTSQTAAATKTAAGINKTAGSVPSGSSSSVIRIEANVGGMLKYNQGSITAPAGVDTITFTNNSPLDHSVVLVNSSNTVLGETPIFDHGTKSFKVKLGPGTYTYYCAVPGHREAGMEGKLTVKAAAG
jgi:plastocyanin